MTPSRKLGNYTLSHDGMFQKRPICIARSGDNQNFTCKRRTPAELNHMRKIMVRLDKSEHVLPVVNVVNTATEAHVLQYEIRGSLSDRVAIEGPMTEGRAARYFKQVLTCLADCSAQNVVIKDLELDHFVITANDSNKVLLHDVMDCEIVNPEEHHEAPITPFIAPEVLMSSQHTTSSNVWSAGVLLYVLLSQHWPFFGNNKEELIQSICSGQYFVHSSWSVELQSLLSTMLCLRPSARLSASQLLHHPWFKIAEMCDPDLYKDYTDVPPTSSSPNVNSMNEK